MDKLNLTKLITEGQNVELYLSSNEEPYVVTVESIEDGGIEITAPLMKGYYMPVESGKMVEIRVGNNNGLFKLPFKITERMAGSISTLKLKPEGEPDKVQRRMLLRMQIFVDFELEFPYGLVFKPPADFSVLHGKRGNLSGGGLFFFANKPLPIDFKLNVKLNLEPHFNRPVIAQAKVIRIEEQPLHENLFGIAIEFMNIREGDRDRIIAYVLHKERDIIRRSMSE